MNIIKRTRRSSDIVIKKNHDSSCFTQGMAFYNGLLYESCGGYIGSRIKIMREISDGHFVVINERFFDEFLEGLVVVNNIIYLLTWKNEYMYLLDSNSLETIGRCYYKGEGWGLTYNGKYFIMSNGSTFLTYVEKPIVGEYIKIINIVDIGVKLINELEYVDGYIYANVWYKDEILKIMDAGAGAGLGSGAYSIIDYSWLRAYERSSGVLNGIAYYNGYFYICGKNWNYVYVVKKN